MRDLAAAAGGMFETDKTGGKADFHFKKREFAANFWFGTTIVKSFQTQPERFYADD
jgi:hypothetical protein